MVRDGASMGMDMSISIEVFILERTRQAGGSE
jgi:hypothetical protein